MPIGRIRILVIRRDAIDVIAKGLEAGGTNVSVADLEQALIQLAITAWRMGESCRIADRSGGA